MTRKVTVLQWRQTAMSARSKLKGALEDIDELLEDVGDVKLLRLVEAVKALRAIANAPDGTPGRNLRGIAQATLDSMSVEWRPETRRTPRTGATRARGVR